MDIFRCFFRVINPEFDSLWLSLTLSFVWSMFNAIFEFFCIKSSFMDEFGCFFREIHLKFDFLWLSIEQRILGAGFMLSLEFFGENYINLGIFKIF